MGNDAVVDAEPFYESWRVFAAVVVGLALAQVRSGRRQRGRDCRDDRGALPRTGADHCEPRCRRQHHQDRHQGFAIGSAAIASVALFAFFIETIGSELGIDKAGTPLFRDVPTQINVANSKTFVGRLIGGAVPFLFCALAVRAVGRTAGVVVQVRFERNSQTARSWRAPENRIAAR